MKRKSIVKLKIIFAVFLGILIDYILFLLFNEVIFDVGSSVAIGLSAYILYSEFSEKL